MVFKVALKHFEKNLIEMFYDDLISSKTVS